MYIFLHSTVIDDFLQFVAHLPFPWTVSFLDFIERFDSPRLINRHHIPHKDATVQDTRSGPLNAFRHRLRTRGTCG